MSVNERPVTFICTHQSSRGPAVKHPMDQSKFKGPYISLRWWLSYNPAAMRIHSLKGSHRFAHSLVCFFFFFKANRMLGFLNRNGAGLV